MHRNRPNVRRALRAAEREVIRLEALLSRFRPSTELSRLNRDGSLRAGRRAVRARAARPRGEGAHRWAFRSRPCFPHSSRRATIAASSRLRATRSGRCSASAIAAGTRPDRRVNSCHPARCRRPARPRRHRQGVDGRSLCRMLDLHGPALVSLGGDIAASRPPATERGLSGSRLPNGPLTIALWTRGGLATSGRDRRRWRRDDEESTTRSIPRPVARRPPISSA